MAFVVWTKAWTVALLLKHLTFLGVFSELRVSYCGPVASCDSHVGMKYSLPSVVSRQRFNARDLNTVHLHCLIAGG